MKISWVILTHNRAAQVNEALEMNASEYWLRPKGIELEIIWVDNGSIDASLFKLDHLADIGIFNHKNIGVARGYNQGFVMATGDYILITGCDRIMPPYWLTRMIEAFEKIPNMGCVSCYSDAHKDISDRYITQEKVEEINGVKFIQALPFEARMFKRERLADVGYFHEGFGLYGWEDCVWGPRFMNIAKEKDLICCTLPDFKAVHLGKDDSEDYQAFKDKQSAEPWKWELVQKLAKEGYPKFTPFL